MITVLSISSANKITRLKRRALILNFGYRRNSFSKGYACWVCELVVSSLFAPKVFSWFFSFPHFAKTNTPHCAFFSNLKNLDVDLYVFRWADTYNLDMLEELVSEPPKCASCGLPATKRCSRCQTEWYCKR